jgi:hypothetical protein
VERQACSVAQLAQKRCLPDPGLAADQRRSAATTTNALGHRRQLLNLRLTLKQPIHTPIVNTDRRVEFAAR